MVQNRNDANQMPLPIARCCQQLAEHERSVCIRAKIMAFRVMFLLPVNECNPDKRAAETTAALAAEKAVRDYVGPTGPLGAYTRTAPIFYGEWPNGTGEREGDQSAMLFVDLDVSAEDAALIAQDLLGDLQRIYEQQGSRQQEIIEELRAAAPSEQVTER